MIESSVFESMCVSGHAGMGRSCMNRLKRVSESTNLCEDPLRKRLFVDGVPFWTV